MAFVMVLLATLVMIACRVLVVSSWGSSLPFLDQWDAEALLLYKPMLEEGLNWTSLWAPHNEHRILFPRLWAILLFGINRFQWDPLAQAYANSIMLSLAVGMLLLAFWRAAEDLHRRLLVVATACAAVSLLAGWDNTIVGFQSCFYFYALFSVLAIDRAARSSPGFNDVVALCFYCGAAWLSLAAGLTTSVVVLALLGLRIRTSSLSMKGAIALTAGPAGILLVGILFTPLVSGHGALAAQDPLEFMVALAVLLHWPYPSVVGVVQWLPFAICLLAMIRGRKAAPFEMVFAGMCLLALFTCLVLALTRGHQATAVASRYTDILAVGLVANMALTYTVLKGRWMHPAVPVLLSTGLAMVMLAALTMETLFRIPALRERGDRMASASHAVVAYLRGDVDTLRGNASLMVFHADGDLAHLEQLVADPTVKRFLPSALLADGRTVGPLSAIAQGLRATVRPD